MKRILKILLVLIFFSEISYPQSGDYVSLKQGSDFSVKMKEYASKLQSIHSNFVQEKHLQYLDAALISQGQFWYKAPNKVRWEYVKPYKYIFILNNGQLKMISENSKNEMDMKGNAIFEQVNNIMISSVNGNILDSKDYGIKILENDQYYLIIMKPTSTGIGSIILQIELYVDKLSYSVAKIKMIENGSDYSLISFSNSKINEGISEELFAH